MRLIDADAFDARLIRLGTTSIKNALDEEPTIDAVPVVRCKHCKYGHDSCGDIACYHTEYDLLEGVLTHEKDFYCKYGERKEGADNEL